MKILKYCYFFPLFLVLFANISAQEKTITVNGEIREYIIEIPENYTGSKPFDLILVYHGMGGTAKGTKQYTGFHSFGTKDKFITVYPQGLDDIDDVFNPGEYTTGWKFEVDNNRDVVFTEVLLDSLQDEYNINPERIFVTGISNGGYFSDILGCNISNRLAAIAPVIGGFPLPLNSVCEKNKPLPTLHLGSQYDGIVSIDHLRKATDFWVVFNDCNDIPEIDDICEVYYDENKNALVYHCEFVCIVDGVEVTEKNAKCHTWPCKGTGYEFETTEFILEFFRKQGLGEDPSDILSDYNNSFDGNSISLKSINIQSEKAQVIFSLSSACNISVILYNLNGKKIKQIFKNKNFNPGLQNISINKSSISNGSYILKFKMGDYSFCRKINLF